MVTSCGFESRRPHQYSNDETMTIRRDNAEFWDLRNAPLHLYGPAEWKGYDPAMAAWLTHSDPEIRKCAIERLCMATLHWDYQRSDRARGRNDVSAARVGTLLAALEKAQHQWPDVIPEFLRNLRWHGDDPHIAPRLQRWIETLAAWPLPPADNGLIEGTKLLLGRREPVTFDRVQGWMALLDAPSAYLRGVAAYLLGQSADDDDGQVDEDVATNAGANPLPTARILRKLIGEKEIQRPGIAGPFYAPSHQIHPNSDANASTAAHWLMDLLERRLGEVPDFNDMPFNDIDFYLHELCCDQPDMMRRMLNGGYTELALMTATEIGGKVDGAEPILKELARDPNPKIATAARAHLARYYVK
jgi:hypothetical protein